MRVLLPRFKRQPKVPEVIRAADMTGEYLSAVASSRSLISTLAAQVRKGLGLKSEWERDADDDINEGLIGGAKDQLQAYEKVGSPVEGIATTTEERILLATRQRRMIMENPNWPTVEGIKCGPIYVPEKEAAISPKIPIPKRKRRHKNDFKKGRPMR